MFNFGSMSSNAGSHHRDQKPPQGPLLLSGMAEGEEIIPECEVIFEDDIDGLDSNFDWCGKNPKHKKFIRICDLKKDDIPEPLRTDNAWNFIQTVINLTVKISIPYTSKDRPRYYPGTSDLVAYPYHHHRGGRDFTRRGTGTVMAMSSKINKQCPCPECKTADQPKMEYHTYNVRTATHNVFDDEEAKVAFIDCFFNYETDEEESKTLKLFGLHIDESDGKKDTKFKTDVCDLICVSHCSETSLRMAELLEKVEVMPSLPESNPFTEIIVSHPHGCTKRISIGTVSCLVEPLRPDYDTCKAYPLPKGVTGKWFLNSSLETRDEGSDDSDDDNFRGRRERRKKGTTKGSEMKKFEIPPEACFYLRRKSNYAMKYHFGEEKKYVTFPRGTKLLKPSEDAKTAMVIPFGTCFEVDESYFPKRYFAENIIGACPGTSGAIVYSNLMEDEVLTDLDHVSRMRDDAQTRFVSLKSNPE